MKVISFGAVLVVFQPAFLFGRAPPPTIQPEEIDEHEGGHRLLGFLFMGICMLGNAIDRELDRSFRQVMY